MVNKAAMDGRIQGAMQAVLQLIQIQIQPCP